MVMFNSKLLPEGIPNDHPYDCGLVGWLSAITVDGNHIIMNSGIMDGY